MGVMQKSLQDQWAELCAEERAIDRRLDQLYLEILPYLNLRASGTGVTPEGIVSEIAKGRASAEDVARRMTEFLKEHT
jgi:hypothetical protein